MITNSIVLLLTNLFEVYVVYRFMSVFFYRYKVNRKTLITIYVLRFVTGTIVMLMQTYSIIIIISSITGLFLITLCYEATFSKQIVTTIIIYMCMFLTEAFIGLVIGNSNFEIFEKVRHIDAIISIIIEVILWIITMFLGKFKNVKKNRFVPKTFIVAMIIVFITSFYMEILTFQQKEINDLISTVSLACAIILNFVMIYLYDSLSEMFEEKTKTELIQREKIYYHNQSELLQKNYDEMKQFRHDIKNRMLAIKEMLDCNDIEKIYNYISKITDKIEHTEVFSQTGNVAIDSIINYKLSKAYSSGNYVKAEIVVPSTINIDDDDIVIILGNLLDNAIEATERLENDKFISLSFQYEKNCAFIKIKNNYDNIIEVVNGQIITRKVDSLRHGIGLKSVQTTVEKYNGVLDLEYYDGEFTASVILYV